MRCPVACIVAAVLALLGTAGPPGDAVATQGGPQETLYTRLLRSTALVRTPSGSGTAWVTDPANKLLVTNFHVVAAVPGYGTYDTVTIVFPVYWEPSHVIAERAYYDEHRAQITAAGRVVDARVVDADETIDLALLAVPSLPTDVTAVPLAQNSPSPSDRLHSIGNPGDSSSLWLYTEGVVKQVAHKTWVSMLGDKLLRHQARVVETQAPLNPGDSGGPVVNDRGELVAVTQGGSKKAALLNWAIDVTEVKRYLSDVAWMPRVQTAADYRRRARHYYHGGYYDTPIARHNRPHLALADLHEAIRRDPSTPDLYLDRAQVYNALGFLQAAPHLTLVGAARPSPPQEYLRALDDCNKAIALRPQDALAYACRARVYSSLHDGALELADLRKAIELDRDCIPAYEGLASYYGYKDAAKAIAYLTEIVRREPQNAGVLESRAAQFRTLQDDDAALKDLDRAIRLDPQDPRYYRARAFLHMDRKRFAQAASDRLQAVHLVPENPYYWRELAESFVAGGEPDQAIAAYTKALDVIQTFQLVIAPTAEILVARGDIYAAKGDLDAAREDYRLALRAEGISAELAKSVKEKLAHVPRP